MYTERAKMAAVSCGTGHAGAVSTPLQWILKYMLWKAIHSCRITCEHTESAREQRIALYKNNHHNNNFFWLPKLWGSLFLGHFFLQLSLVATLPVMCFLLTAVSPLRHAAWRHSVDMSESSQEQRWRLEPLSTLYSAVFCPSPLSASRHNPDQGWRI